MEHYETCSFRKKAEKIQKDKNKIIFNTFKHVLFSISRLHN